MTDSPEMYRLAQEINQLRREMRTLGRANQAPYRSVEVAAGGTTYYAQDGTPLQRTGILSDGTFGTVNLDPSTPPTPTSPDAEPVINGIKILWDGTFLESNWTGLVSHIEVHVSDTPDFDATDLTQIAVFTSPRGGEVIFATPNDIGIKYVALVTVSHARVESPKSEEASAAGLPTDQITIDLIDDVIQAQATADGKNTIYYDDTAPTGGTYKIDDIWFNTGAGNQISRWDGDSWEPTLFTGTALEPGSIGAAELADVIETAISDAAAAAAAADAAADAAQAAADAAAAAAAAAQVDADTAQASADGKSTVWRQSGAPSGTDHNVGDTWFDTDDGNKIYQWDGDSWEAAELGTNAIANLAITNAKIGNLDAAKITTGTLDAARIGADSITAVHIAAGAVDTAELAAGSIIAVKIAAGQIDATKMVVGTITAASGILANASVGSAQIIDASVGTAEIADAAITTAKIGNLQVTNSLLAAGIDAAKITVGTLDAGRISAGSITSDKLSISTFATEMVANGSFEDGIVGWSLTTGTLGTFDTVTGIAGSSGANVARLVRNATAGTGEFAQSSTQYIPVTATAGGKWSVAARARATAGLASGFYLRAYFFQGDKVTPSATASADIANNVALTTGFQRFAAQITIPSDAKYMRLAVRQTTASSTTYVDEITAREVVSAVEIADGSIDATKINAQTLTGVTIQTDAAANTGVKITTAGVIAYNVGGTASARMEPTGTYAGGFTFYNGATLVGGMAAGAFPGSLTGGIYLHATGVSNRINQYAPGGIRFSRHPDDPAMGAITVLDGSYSINVGFYEDSHNYPARFAVDYFQVQTSDLNPDPTIFADASQSYIRDGGSGGSFFRATAGRCDATGQFVHSYASINGFVSTGLNNTISAGTGLAINPSNAICFRVSSGLKHKVDVRPLRSYLNEPGDVHGSDGVRKSARASAMAFIGLMDDIPMEEPTRGGGRGRLVDIEPIIYKDRHEVEMHMADDPDWSPFPRDWIGWAADDVAEAGWEELVTRDPHTGEFDYLHYDRMLPVVVLELLEELASLRSSVVESADEVAALRSRIETIEKENPHESAKRN